VRIPPEKIEDVRNTTDIIDLIGGFVKLKKRGKNYLGLCPFHGEKTPSFNVSADRQMYHCFGCGVGGNVFTFVMEYEKVSFVEAVRSLAEKAGIVLPSTTSESDQAASEQEQLYEVCRMAARFFYDSMTETSEGKLALEYFRKVREFSDDTIRAFGLGYSPNSWDALIKYAHEKSISPEVLEKAGLARKREDGSHYDYFRGRAMFPIFSSTGRVLGFGARKLREDDPISGKYINSPDTLIYNKSKLLYGIAQSKEAIREAENAILVEGYADLISVFQAGIKNAVASSGTALTEEQIVLISRYSKTITIIYDADSAGSKAALRGVDLVLEKDLDVKVAALPEGEDPDSFVKKNGGDVFRELIVNAVSFVDFIALTYERQGKFDSPEGQAQVVRSIVQTIAKMKDELKRNFYIKHVAEKYKLYESTLYRELEKHLGNSRREHQRVSSQQPATHTEQENGEQRIPSQAIEIPAAERDLIHAMLDGGSDVINLIFQHIHLEDFSHPVSRTLVANLLHRLEEGETVDPNTLVNDIEDAKQRRFIAETVFSKYQLSKAWDDSGLQTEEADPRKLAADALVVLRRNMVDAMMKENLRLQREARSRGEDTASYGEQTKQLAEERNILQKRIYEGFKLSE
jgi:DNA primase